MIRVLNYYKSTVNTTQYETNRNNRANVIDTLVKVLTQTSISNVPTMKIFSGYFISIAQNQYFEGKFFLNFGLDE
jgi:hypothetical protein